MRNCWARIPGGGSVDKIVEVLADWPPFSEPRPLGRLRIVRVRGKETYSFSVDREWLRSGKDVLLLDPELQWVDGEQFSKDGFGMFLDSAPDRWGRRLITRREARRAREEGRSPRQLMTSDFLLAVSDRTRLGGLRFRDMETGEFLGPDTEDPIPPLRALRALEAAARHFERETGDDREMEEGLRLLLAPGSSLGGARPKANTMDPEGALWIAKFPSPRDEGEVGAWEGLVHELARRVGLRVSKARVERFSEAGHTFLARRFDREGGGRRHFASAMTLLGYRDGDDAESGVSYLELAELICSIGGDVERDLIELWTRIAFSVAVGNGDDHLRNHGFLLGKKGWHLSPLYDVNPQPWVQGLSLNITEFDNALDFELLREVAEDFRVSVKEAGRVLEQLSREVGIWRELAKERGLSHQEIERMETAFLL